MIYIGIDPGANGAIAVIAENAESHLNLKDATEKDIFEYLT